MKDYEVFLEGFSLQEVVENPMALRAYREVYENLKDRLLVGYPIPDELEVSIIGNNRLLETTFRLRSIDRIPLEGSTNPGKSAHISHTRIPDLACITQLGRPLKRQDRLYIVPAPTFRERGFSPIYSPTPKRPLHVRLVPHHLDSEGDISRENRIQLVELIQGYQIQNKL